MLVPHLILACPARGTVKGMATVSPASRPWAVAAAVGGLLMLVGYVALVVGQGDVRLFDVLPWAVLMAVAAGAALAGARVGDRRIARSLLVAAAVLYALLGVAALFTIGLGFLVAAIAAAVAAIRS